MLNKMIARLSDWLIAIAIVCLLLWFFITQPLLPVNEIEELPVANQQNLQNHVINLRRIVASSEQSGESLTPDNYIYNYFARLGSPQLQPFTTMSGYYNNVSLMLGPKTAERIVIGVQYLPPTSPLRDQWNPSGVAVMLEAARMLSEYADELPVRVQLMAYASAGIAANGTLDMGSYHHSQALKKRNVPVKLMIALQSVGYYRDEIHSQRYPFSFMKMLYPDVGNFISLTSRLEDFMVTRSVKQSFRRVPDLLVESLSAPENFPMVSGSDHVNFWLNDYPALQISDLLSLRAPEASNAETLPLNYERMAQVVQALHQTVKDISGHKSDDTAYMTRLISRLSDFFD